MSRPDGGALHSFDKFPKVTATTAAISMSPASVSGQMDGGLGYDGVPRVQPRIMTNDDAHPERQSARDRSEAPIAAIVTVPPPILNTTPLLEQKSPGSVQRVRRH